MRRHQEDMSSQQKLKRSAFLTGQRSGKKRIDYSLKGQDRAFLIRESLAGYFCGIPGAMPVELAKRLDCLDYTPTLEEEEKMYEIYKRVTRRMFDERYGK